MGTDFSLANGCPGGIRATMGFMIGNKTDGAFLAATGYLKIVAVFYVFCFTGNTFAGYFDGIGRVNIPFIGAVGHITLRVILSWIFVSRFQLNAVAVATGIGWMLVNLFWSGCYFHPQPGRCRILNNRTHLPPKGWDDRLPGCGILPGAVSCGRWRLLHG